jgi:hypothetical protein
VTNRFTDGFDKYCQLSGVNDAISANNLALRWNGATVGSLVAPLSNTGFAVALQGNQSLGSQAIGAPTAKILLGCRMSQNNGGNAGFWFTLGSTAICWVAFNTSGNVTVGTGNSFGSGTLFTSAQSVAANSTNVLEIEILLSTTGTGTCKIYLNGLITSINQSGLTWAAATYDNFTLHSGSGSVTIYDDLYINDNSGSFNNTLLLTNPRIETDFPNSDSAVQFTAQVGVLGRWDVSNNNANSAPGANRLVLRKYTPQVNCTINSIGIVPQATSAAAKFKGVIYNDSGGAAHTLLSSGTEVVGTTANTRFNLALVTPQALTGGTPYWIGYITDTSVSLYQSDSSLLGFSAANTYGSGAPGTAPAMTGSLASWAIYGNLTGMAANYPQENQVPPSPGNLNGTNTSLNYNQDSVVNHEDLFGFPAIATTPNSIYCVNVYGLVQNSDAGARTVSLHMKSLGVDVSGGAQAPGTSWSYIVSLFETDSGGVTPWTSTTLNAATSGYKIDS